MWHLLENDTSKKKGGAGTCIHDSGSGRSNGYGQPALDDVAFAGLRPKPIFRKGS